MKRSAFALLACLCLRLASPRTVNAQDDFSHVKAKLGQLMFVTENGLSVEGPLVALSPAAMMVDGREFKPRPGLKIERSNGNTVGRGMAIGAGVGAGLAVASGGTPAAALLGALPGAFWGAVIGAARDRRTTVYDSTAGGPVASPQLTLPVAVANGGAPGFAALRLHPGQHIFITNDGVTVSGTLSDLRPDRITIGGRDFTPGTGLKIEKEGDPLWNGAAYGFAAGALVGSTLGAEACLNEPLWHCAVASGTVWAGIGALIDSAHKGRTTVYDTSSASSFRQALRHVAPILSSRERGVAIALIF